MSKSNVQFSYPVEQINRKMTLRKNTASSVMHVAVPDGSTISVDKDVARYMGAMTRTSVLKGVGAIKRNFLFIRFNKRSTEVGADEIAARNLFGNTSKLRTYWRKTVAEATKASQAWKNNQTIKGVSPYGKTFMQWLYQIASAVIQDGGTTTSPFPNA